MGLGKKATAISNELYAIEVCYVQFDSILDARLVDIFVLLKRIRLLGRRFEAVGDG